MTRIVRFKGIKTLAIAVAFAVLPMLAHAQTTVKGHVNNELTQPVAGVTVGFSQDGGKTFKYTADTDANGDYTVSVAPGDYTVFVTDPKVPDKTKNMVDVMPNVKVGTTPLTQDFDMSRKEFMDKLPPERRKQIEEIKQKNAAALAANSQVKNLNAALTKARADIAAGNYQPAIDAMTQAVQAKPDEPVLVYTLGSAQLGAGKYDDAITSFKKAIELGQAAKKPQPEVIGAAYNDLAKAQAKSGKVDDAVASYEAAAKIDPAHAELYARNETITLTAANKPDQAAAAADRWIAANPQNADAYFLKGQALVQKASVDKAGKIVLPPGCAEAYQKYLELAPTGPHAQDAKEVLASAGETIHSSYKAGKKS
jgi:Flp pilus assembly protein TadD